MPASADLVRDRIAPVLERAGVDLEAVQVQSAGRRDIVRVVVDRDGGVDLDLIAELSRDISEILDAPGAADALSASYVLEVTSPGVDRPLTEARHWRRAVGRLVEAELADGSVVTGRIASADDAQVVIDGRGLALADLVRGMVQIEFTRPQAGLPDGDVDGEVDSDVDSDAEDEEGR